MSDISRLATLLTTERDSKLKTQEEYKNRIAKLPKGSISKKDFGYGVYYYLSYQSSETKKPSTKYVGKESVALAMQEQIEERQTLEKKLRVLNQELEVIEKMLRPAKKYLERGNIAEKLKEVREDNDIGVKSPSENILTDVKNIHETQNIKNISNISHN